MKRIQKNPNSPIANMLISFLIFLFGYLVFATINPNSHIQAEAESSAVPKSIIFRDNFNNLQKSGWTKFDEGTESTPSEWNISAFGIFSQSGNIGGGSPVRGAIEKPGTYVTAGNSGWKDYEYSVRLSSSDDDAMGVVFRYKDSDNYYRFSMDKERGYRRLVKKVNGVYTLIAEENQGYSKNMWYTISTKVVGNSIKILVNNSLAFDVVDDSLTRGRIGVYSWSQQNSYFDDVKVSASVDSFTIAVLPDTQYYTRFYPSVFTAQTQWLASNRGSQNIAYVLHEGDITDTNSQTEWRRATSSMSYLDGKLSYALVGGNHDLPIDRFNQYFPAGNYAGMPGFGGTYRPGKMDNNYHLFKAGGVNWLIIGLEWGARDEVLAWANRIAEQYPNRHTIVLTHAYLYSDSTLQGSSPDHNPGWAPSYPGSNNGVGIWNKFVKRQPNIQFVFNGHVWNKGGTGKLVSSGNYGNKVYQMLADYQGLDPPTDNHIGRNGGNGYMRLLKFFPAEGRVEVKTYSPYLNKYLTDSENQFEFNDVAL